MLQKLFRQFVSSSHSSTHPKTTVELLFDIISPFNYVQFELLTRQRLHWKSMSLQFTPVLLNGILKLAGNQTPAVVPAKAVYLISDLARLANYHKISLQLPPNYLDFAFSGGSMRGQRFLLAIKPHISDNQYEQLIRLFYQCIFSPDKCVDISNVDTIRQKAIEVGVDKTLVDGAIEVIDTQQNKNKLILLDNSQRAIDVSGFGVPITLVHLSTGTEMVFGSDRMHIVGHLLGEFEPPILK